MPSPIDLANDFSSEPLNGDDMTYSFVGKMNRDMHEAKLNNFNQNMAERKKYAFFIWQFTIFWSVFIGCIILWTAMGKLVISDAVLITLITTTSANIFGFFYLVTKYLFNQDKST